MGCESSQMPEEQGEIRNSNIAKTNEPDFSHKNITPDAASPRVNPQNLSANTGGNQITATGKPLFFCVNNSTNGDMIDVQRDTSGAPGKKKVSRV